MHPSPFKILAWCALLWEPFLDCFPLFSMLWVLSPLELAGLSSPSYSSSLLLDIKGRNKGAQVGVNWTQSWFQGCQQQPRQWGRAFQEGRYCMWCLPWLLEAEQKKVVWIQEFLGSIVTFSKRACSFDHFFLIFLFLAALGLHRCTQAFSSWGKWGLLSGCSGFSFQWLLLFLSMGSRACELQ